MSAERQKDFWDKINEHVDAERDEVDRAFKEDGNRTIYIKGLKDTWENIDDFYYRQSMTMPSDTTTYNTWQFTNNVGTTSYSMTEDPYWRYNDGVRLHVNTVTLDPFHSIT